MILIILSTFNLCLHLLYGINVNIRFKKISFIVLSSLLVSLLQQCTFEILALLGFFELRLHFLIEGWIISFKVIVSIVITYFLLVLSYCFTLQTDSFKPWRQLFISTFIVNFLNLSITSHYNHSFLFLHYFIYIIVFAENSFIHLLIHFKVVLTNVPCFLMLPLFGLNFLLLFYFLMEIGLKLCIFKKRGGICIVIRVENVNIF